MLKTTPSRIELKQEDIREYETMKDEWRKELQSSITQNRNNSSNRVDVAAQNAQKNERHSRMGFVSSNN